MTSDAESSCGFEDKAAQPENGGCDLLSQAHIPCPDMVSDETRRLHDQRLLQELAHHHQDIRNVRDDLERLSWTSVGQQQAQQADSVGFETATPASQQRHQHEQRQQRQQPEQQHEQQQELSVPFDCDRFATTLRLVMVSMPGAVALLAAVELSGPFDCAHVATTLRPVVVSVPGTVAPFAEMPGANARFSTPSEISF